MRTGTPSVQLSSPLDTQLVKMYNCRHFRLPVKCGCRDVLGSESMNVLQNSAAFCRAMTRIALSPEPRASQGFDVCSRRHFLSARIVTMYNCRRLRLPIRSGCRDVLGGKSLDVLHNLAAFCLPMTRIALSPQPRAHLYPKERTCRQV